MKKLILSLALVACTGATNIAQAQDDPPKRPAAGAGGAGGGGGAARFSPEERLKMLTSSLGLTQEQQDKIKKIMDDSRPELEKVRGLPQEERRGKFRAVMQAQNDKIAEALTPEQRDKFKAAMAQRGQGRAGGAGAPAGDAPKKEGEKPAAEPKK